MVDSDVVLLPYYSHTLLNWVQHSSKATGPTLYIKLTPTPACAQRQLTSSPLFDGLLSHGPDRSSCAAREILAGSTPLLTQGVVMRTLRSSLTACPLLEGSNGISSFLCILFEGG